MAKYRLLFGSAPLPQLDRGTDYESVRRGFESLTAHHLQFLLYLGQVCIPWPYGREGFEPERGKQPSGLFSAEGGA